MNIYNMLKNSCILNMWCPHALQRVDHTVQLVVPSHGIRSLPNDIVHVCMCNVEVGSLWNRLCGITT